MNIKLLSFLICVLLLGSIIVLVEYTHLEEEYVEITGGSLGEKYYGMEETKKAEHEDKLMKFDLLDPECAPADMLNKVLYGYHIMLETKKNCGEFCGNSIDCTNCHFDAGNNLGGKNRGISLVGVTAMYPKYSKRDKKTISLVDRISNCFQRSLNGKVPPKDSLQMEAMVAYLAWISQEVMNAPALPWLGLNPIKSQHVPDAKNGSIVYENKCMICHGLNGSGDSHVPAIWGEKSFNDGAGMNTLPMLSSFVLMNMPLDQPDLTPEEALDVAAYVISQPRPHFTP